MTSLDLHGVQKTITLNGKTYKMDFDMQAFSFAEMVYKTEYGLEADVATVISDLFEAKLTPVMAFSYGAIRSAGEAVTWKKFSKEIFTYENYDEVMSVVVEAITEMFDSGDKADPSEVDLKN